MAKGAIHLVTVAGAPTLSCDTTQNGFTLTASYVLSQNGEQVTEVGGDGQWVHTNVYAGGMLLATYTDSGVHFHLTDWLGTRRVQADYLGRVEAVYRNLPFGDPLPGSNPLELGATEQHFTGKERDTESGNDYFGARYMSSTMGRFMSPDPLGFEVADNTNPQSWNFYGYVLNNPLRLIDPFGYYHCDPDTTSSTGSDNATVTAGRCQFDDWDFYQINSSQTITPKSLPQPPPLPRHDPSNCGLGNAPSITNFQAKGAAVANALTSGDVLQEADGMGQNISNLYNFRHGGALDAQKDVVNPVVATPYANYAYGIYMSAAGYSLQQL